jgi:signal transduction histidine kinase
VRSGGSSDARAAAPTPTGQPSASASPDDARALRACIRDLVSLSALPALWSDATPAAILAGLADALVATLRLDVVYVRLDADEEATIDLVRARDGDQASRWAGLAALARGAGQARLPAAVHPDDGGSPVRLDVAPLATGGQIGVVLGGSARPDYPTETDRLLLGFAANQAAIALRGARLAEQRARAERERAALLEREREARAELETVHRVGQVLSAELDLRALVQGVTDATTEITGARFGAFFYNLLDERGESYTLYTLSGVPREAFDGFPMPRNTEVFGPTFRGEGVVRLDDVHADPRYGRNPPYNGMPPGHLPVVSYLAVPVVSRSGEVLGGLFFGHPEPGRFTARHENIVAGIAAQTAVAMDNAQLYQEARDAVRARDQFLSVAAHELKTPVTGVKGSAQLLERILDRGGLDEDRLRRLTTAIVGSSNRLVALVDDLLDVSRIRSGQLALDVAPVDVADLLRRLVSDYADRLDERHRLALAAPAGRYVLSADAGRLEQVFVNLLDNAVKYSPSGGEIDVDLASEPDGTRVRVRDQGIGLPADAREAIFRPFGRAANATERHLPGMGLGLYICRSIVEQHGGRMWAESEGDGCGTTVVVLLPRAPDAGTDAGGG